MFKKLTSSLLAVAMLASMGTTVFAAETSPNQSNNISATSVASPRWHRSYINQNNVRFRTGPGTNYTAIGQLQYNDTVEPDYDTETLDSNGMMWIEVYSERHQRNGWIAHQYLTNEGEMMP